jgi:hypothetical protein
MLKMMDTTQSGLTRIFAQFGRRHDRLEPRRDNARDAVRWYESDVCSRGL